MLPLFSVGATLAGMAATESLARMRAWVPALVMVFFAILLLYLLVGTRMSFRISRAVLDRLRAPISKVVVVRAGPLAESAGYTM